MKKKMPISLSAIALAALIIFFAVMTKGVFIGPSNLRNLVSQGFTMTMVTAGAAFIYATGSIDMSVGAVFGLSEIAAGLVMRSLLPGGFAMLVAIAVAVACTSITALVFSKLNVAPFIASLCMFSICNGLISWIVEDGEIYINYSAYKTWDNSVIHGFVILLVLVLGYFLFTRTRIGKYARAIGGNPKTAEISGINKTRAIWLCYAIMGICIGLAGFFGMVRTTRISSGSNTMALNTITAIVLGGFPLRGGARARFVNAVIGAVTVTVLGNGLTLMGMDPSVTLLVKGILFLIVVGVGTDRSKGKLV